MNHKPFKVCANLPYYITTPIIMKLLEQKLPIEKIVVMVQKEVAERMVAAPGSKIYGALSVSVQYYTEPRMLFEISPKCFMPAPEVTSAVVSMDVRQTPPVQVQDAGILEASRIDGSRRGETMSLQEFADVADAWSHMAADEGK